MSIKKIVLATFLTSGIVATAQAGSVSPSDKSIETELCVSAANGNRAAMHNKIKASGYSAKFIAKNVQCNGESILAFVEKYGKNSEVMNNLIDRSSREVTITDIAKNSLEVK